MGLPSGPAHPAPFDEHVRIYPLDEDAVSRIVLRHHGVSGDRHGEVDSLDRGDHLLAVVVVDAVHEVSNHSSPRLVRDEPDAIQVRSVHMRDGAGIRQEGDGLRQQGVRQVLLIPVHGPRQAGIADVEHGRELFLVPAFTQRLELSVDAVQFLLLSLHNKFNC